MVNIFYGRDNLDKEKFIYDNVASDGGSNIIIVPDQYTLEAEKQAFRYLKIKGLVDIEILSFSRLGDRLIAKYGGNKLEFINTYGKYILLSKIIKDEKDNLQIFSGQEKKKSFIEMVSEFIGNVKKYQSGLDNLIRIKDEMQDSTLKRKLSDLLLIASKYQDVLKDKYTDSDDYIDLYIDKIKDSDEIKESNIWIYGFDTFTPKYMEIIRELAKNAKTMNIILTYDENCRDCELFKISHLVIRQLREMFEDVGIASSEHKIDGRYVKKYNNLAIKHMEHELFSNPYNEFKGEADIEIIQSANPYNEAETAASYVLKLVRERNMRFRDIVILCNDQEKGVPIIQRVFDEYGIKTFVDKKRDILNSNIIIYILSLLEIIKNKCSTSSIMEWLKTGLSGIDLEKIEDIENYAYKYGIRGNMWKSEFVFGLREYDTDGLEHINSIRKEIMGNILLLESLVKESNTVKEFSMKFFSFLEKELSLPCKIDELIKYQEQLGAEGKEFAGESGQIWNSFVTILEQIVALVGDVKFDLDEYIDLLEAGLGNIEIGLLPPTADGIIIGTTQRTRVSRAKAVFILSANEGLLPKNSDGDMLFSPDENEIFAELGGQISKLDSIQRKEEKLAIYRAFSLPTDYLFVSLCISDAEGNALRESLIYGQIIKIFDNVEIKNDILNRDSDLEMLGGEVNTLRHLTEKLRESVKNDELNDVWKQTLLFYKERAKRYKIAQEICFTNDLPNISREDAKSLYMKENVTDLVVSPSRLEKFSRCPFSHFISYGLRLSEREKFEVSPRAIGDVYHSILMKLSSELTQDDMALTDENSKWMNISYEECKSIVEKIAKEEIPNYNEGVFNAEIKEKYRAKRLIENCTNVGWMLINQVRAGTILESSFEEKFGRGQKLAPITVEVGNDKILIEGKIDRVDILPEDRVKIIDYKTGNEKFSVEEASKGYRLQLMLYLKAAEEMNRKPAGVFYFLIKERNVDLKDISNASALEKSELLTKIKEAIYKEYKMNGILVDNPTVINSLDKNASNYSKVVPIQVTKKSGVKGSLLTEEEFEKFENDFDEKVKDICNRLINGNIKIKPMKTKVQSACTYCKYKGICRFDTVFSGCKYESI